MTLASPTHITQIVTKDNIHKFQKRCPEWLEEEMRDAKREAYLLAERYEDSNEHEVLNNWINQGGY